MPDDRIGGSLLHDAAVIHHQHPVTELLHQRNVVADEQDGQTVSLLGTKFIQQFQNFLLHGHIQRGGGFITDEKPWLHGKGPGDGRPLALTAADLMGIAIRKVSRKPPQPGRS